jgi:hypothetical protein
MPSDLLVYDDKLPTLCEFVAGGSVDLVYLDPPFNNGQSYDGPPRSGTTPGPAGGRASPKRSAHG